MLVKKTKKNSFFIPIVIIILLSYIALRVMTVVEENNGNFELQMISDVVNNIYLLNSKLIINTKTIGTSFFVGIFGWMIYETIKLQNRKNIQENTHGSAEWCSPKDVEKKRDKEFRNNTILTQTEMISRNMKISEMNRHVILLGRPGTR